MLSKDNQYTEDCVPEEKALKLKHIEDKIDSIQQQCWSLASEFDTTEQIIYQGVDNVCEESYKEKQPKIEPNRYIDMDNILNNIANSLNKSRERIRDLRMFFDK